VRWNGTNEGLERIQVWFSVLGAMPTLAVGMFARENATWPRKRGHGTQRHTILDVFYRRLSLGSRRACVTGADDGASSMILCQPIGRFGRKGSPLNSRHESFTTISKNW
jgi:hypothetical protein